MWKISSQTGSVPRGILTDFVPHGFRPIVITTKSVTTKSVVTDFVQFLTDFVPEYGKLLYVIHKINRLIGIIYSFQNVTSK